MLKKTIIRPLEVLFLGILFSIPSILLYFKIRSESLLTEKKLILERISELEIRVRNQEMLDRGRFPRSYIVENNMRSSRRWER